MFRHIVEGWSRENYEDAIFAAMRRAAEYLTGATDIHIFIRELAHSEEQGYHAVLELTKEPMSVRLDLDMEDDPAHRAKMEFDHAFRVLRRKEHDHMEHAIAAHFEKTGKSAPACPVPDFILASMTDVSVENDEVEKEFDHAAHQLQTKPEPQPDAPGKPRKYCPHDPAPE